MALPIEQKDGSFAADYTRISGERPHQCKVMRFRGKARTSGKYGLKNPNGNRAFLGLKFLKILIESGCKGKTYEEDRKGG
jgi:hypothetical protein